MLGLEVWCWNGGQLFSRARTLLVKAKRVRRYFLDLEVAYTARPYACTYKQLRWPLVFRTSAFLALGVWFMRMVGRPTRLHRPLGNSRQCSVMVLPELLNVGPSPVSSCCTCLPVASKGDERVPIFVESCSGFNVVFVSSPVVPLIILLKILSSSRARPFMRLQ